MAAFEQVCVYAKRAGLLVIADGKRGDIGSTARAYSEAYLEGDVPRADALTVNPWLGRDAIEPFLGAVRRGGVGIFVLVRTSNASGDLQDVVLKDGRPMWHHVAELVDEWGAELVGEAGLSSVGAVVGATHPRAVAEARRLMPRSILLLPGRRRAGRQARRPGPRVPERAGERARRRLALGHLRVPRRRLGLSRGGGRRGRAPEARGLGRIRLVVPRGDWRRFVAPAAFLLAATVAVLLIRSGLHPSTTATTTTRAVPAAPTKTVGAVTNTTKAKKKPRAARGSIPCRRETRSASSRTKTGVAVATIEQLNPNISSTSLFIGEKVRIR